MFTYCNNMGNRPFTTRLAFTFGFYGNTDFIKVVAKCSSFVSFPFLGQHETIIFSSELNLPSGTFFTSETPPEGIEGF